MSIDRLKSLHQQATELLREHGPKDYLKERTRLGKMLKQARHLEHLRATVAKATPPKPRPTAPRDKPGFVYVVGSAGHPVKIGIANNVANRLATLQTSSPVKLRVYFHIEVSDARAVERACHERLSDYRLAGEWFDMDPYEAAEFVRSVASEMAD